MKVRGLVLVLALLVMPSMAFADPVWLGNGNWTTASTRTTNDDAQSGYAVNPFWGGLSWDCDQCGVGYLIDAYGADNIEYLNDGFGNAVNFRFDLQDTISTPSYFAGITAWTNGVFGRREDGAFSYDNGMGFSSNSWENGRQYALFRIVGPESTRYFLGIEDIPVIFALNDHDHNDYVVTFEQRHNVPEPSTLLLLGVGAIGMALRKRRQSAA